jgi:CO/xanthine dehydrogenase FAD-binding subunit
MIIEYHRPGSLDEAINLLGRKNPTTLPLGGGTILSVKQKLEDFAVVDIQNLGLNRIDFNDNLITIGTACSLQSLIDSSQIDPALKKAISREISYNMRNMATIGGTIIAADGCSPLLTALSAIDAKILWQPESVEILLAEWLPLRENKKPGLLLEKIQFGSQVKLEIKSLGRSPQDYPIATVAIAQWKNGRVRVVIGADRERYPIMAMDGSGIRGAYEAVKQICKTALVGHKHETYFSNVLPELVRQMTQAL